MMLIINFWLHILTTLLLTLIKIAIWFLITLLVNCFLIHLRLMISWRETNTRLVRAGRRDQTLGVIELLGRSIDNVLVTFCSVIHLLVKVAAKRGNIILLLFVITALWLSG